MNDAEGDEQIHDTEVDRDVDGDEGEDEEEEFQKGYIYRCLKKSGCSYIANLPSRWPRSCGVLLGVVRKSVPGIQFGHTFAVHSDLSGIANDLFSCSRFFHFFR